jgi:TonB family protein
VRLIRILVAAIVLSFVSNAWARAPAPPEGLVPPRVLAEVEVEYPPALAVKPDAPSGRVVVELVIGTDGVPHSVRVVESVHPELDALVVAAVEQLRYEPGTLDGERVEIKTTIEVDLSAPKRPPRISPAPAPALAAAPEAEGPRQLPGTGPLRIEGRVLEAGKRTPIAGASILAVPAAPDAEPGHVKRERYTPDEEPAWQLPTFTDDDGRFELRGVPSGLVRIVVLAPGFDRLEWIESLADDQALTVRYYVTRAADNPYRTVVRAQRAEREEVTRRSITPLEIGSLPGTQGDALKSIQNFPGIARAPFGIGLLVIRGADPTDSAVFLGEHEIPQLFHFGGITSVFNADVLTTIDYIPGNFDARYGDAIGGIIDVHTRPGRRDGVHGYIDSDLFDSGFIVEGPLGKGSFVLAARRSYIDLLLPAFIPDDAGLDLSIAPRYYDYQVLVDQPISRGNLSIKIFGSDDRTRIVAADPNEVTTDDRNRFETTLVFHRADLAYTNRRGRWDFLLTPSYRYDSYSANISDFFRFAIGAHTFSGRAEVGRTLGRRSRIDIGTQLYAGTFTLDAESPPVPQPGVGSTGTRLQLDSKQGFASPALHATAQIGLGERFLLIPGVRLTYYAMLFQRAATDPRVRFAWRVGDNTTLRGGVGLYSQIPDAPEWNPVFGNPRIGLERGVHTSVSVAHRFPHAITLEVAGFYKHLLDLAAPSTEIVIREDGQVGLENFANTGRGRIYGGEVFLRKELTRNVFGWLSYTLSRSERHFDPREGWFLFDLDQTHILTLIGVYRLPRGWQLGARFRLVSGNPTTPVTGAVYDAREGEYLCIEGKRNSDRVPPFHQLDLRVDRRFTWKRVSLLTYIDVQNVYNHQNPEFLNYSFDCRQSQPISSLPIIPSVGVRLEW